MPLEEVDLDHVVVSKKALESLKDAFRGYIDEQSDSSENGPFYRDYLDPIDAMLGKKVLRCSSTNDDCCGELGAVPVETDTFKAIALKDALKKHVCLRCWIAELGLYVCEECKKIKKDRDGRDEDSEVSMVCPVCEARQSLKEVGDELKEAEDKLKEAEAEAEAEKED